MPIDTSKALKDSPLRSEKIAKLENKARVAELLLECKEHGGLKMVLTWLENRVNTLNSMLSADRKANVNGDFVRLDTIDRAELDAARTECIAMIELFPDAANTLARIEKKIKSYERD